MNKHILARPSRTSSPRRHPYRPLALAALAAGMATAQAADAPPGMQLQQPVPPAPSLNQPVLPKPADPSAAITAAGTGAPGLSVELKAIELQGNTRIDSASLLAAIGPPAGRRFDFEGLRGLAQAVTRAYRAQGYPFSVAVLPPQNLSSGTLTIEVIEGVYGRISVQGQDPQTGQAQAFLDPELKAGDAIRDQPLERAMLLLNDQPGYRVQPLLRPGAQRAEGDLIVNVDRRNHRSIDVGLDNAGSRATGEYRARAALSLNSPWRFGDRLGLTALVTDKEMWLGSVEYETPLGGRGLRAGVSAARTSYQLAQGFSVLDAAGQADVLGARLSHALIRSQQLNLMLNLNLQHKQLHDDFGKGLLVRNKRSHLATVGAQFDLRDRFGGGGVSYGSVNATWGHLNLDAASRVVDADTANSAGRFHKLNLDLARIQKLPGMFSAYARVSGQWAGKNLDSSEKYGLGGFLGVRAYPLGEATGDSGWLTQLELRADPGPFTVFAFHDLGRMRTNQRPWAPNTENLREIGGVGLGLRWAAGSWTLEATVATRTEGGAPTSDTRDTRTRAFVVLGHRWD